MDLSLIERLSDNRIYRAALAKRDRLAIMSNKDLTSTRVWAPASQVRHERLSDIRSQRKHERLSRLGLPHVQYTGPPVDVVQAELDDLMRSKTVHREKQQHRIISSPNWRPTIDAS
jgi:hypothetical protein